METDLVWLRGELRLADNPLLASPGGISERLVVYVIDAALLEPQAPLDIPRMGARRLRFLWQSLRELRGELLKCGSDLLVTVGEPVTLVANLAERIGASAVRVGEHPGSEEQQQVQRLSQLLHPGCRLDTFSTATLWAHATLPIAVEEVPGSWSAFKRKLGKAKPSAKALPAAATQPAWPDRAPRGLPSLQRLSPAAAALDDHPDPLGLGYVGGAASGLDRLDEYFWKQQAIGVYQDTRNGLIGPDFSSRLSAWLATGCISATQVLGALTRWEQEHGANASTKHFYRELLWREYFHWAAWQEGSALFGKRAPAPGQAFTRWQQGETGQPAVDAAMKELRDCGWISNRARQWAASYLVHDLCGDWRHGAAWFEHCLMDYDVASNWGNWKYIAGVGRDTRPKVFDMDDQVRRYDPELRYVQHWLEKDEPERRQGVS
ncbi:DASH family cryptochrome [Halomonas sp. DP8Y7-3]|uniref:DASH family cryptochrome n=1 Tax=Halomonas sp. DP8Y7-3 TaxID=2859079 RepID=UPI001C961BDD|nr:DASH family cryptochrome [Halomonas sp. DP8Y7-3]MBY5929656.1 DASH family cryptochrome [Halomonas sp. DP8Y7-3]